MIEYVHRVFSKRRAGVLLPITALPDSENKTSEQGDFGQAYRFIDFLAEAGFSVWQLLPLGPTHWDHSPYQCLSAHAGNPQLISLQGLQQQGYLPKQGLKENVTLEKKQNYLTQAFHYFKKTTPSDQYFYFVKQHQHWLNNYALFMTIRASQGNCHWMYWETKLRDRNSKALESVKKSLSQTIEKIQFEQFIFYQQWQSIKSYAHQKNIFLVGDMPLFVAYDSTDVWSYPEAFMVDAEGRAEIVTGVPPDCFSDNGQRWGNPQYR